MEGRASPSVIFLKDYLPKNVYRGAVGAMGIASFQMVHLKTCHREGSAVMPAAATNPLLSLSHHV